MLSSSVSVCSDGMLPIILDTFILGDPPRLHAEKTELKQL